MLDSLVEAGIENVMALRGDPPGRAGKFERPAGGFGYAADLVAFIRKRYGKQLCLGGAGNPEGHLECRDIDQDIRHLKAKVDAGLDFVVTQLFFDNRVLLRLRGPRARRRHHGADRPRPDADPHAGAGSNG